MRVFTTAAALALSALMVVACGSNKEATRTEPPIHPPVEPPIDYGDVCKQAGLDAFIVTLDGSGICDGRAGSGTCLPAEDWFEEGGQIYDVWYCEAEGDTITFCPCGDDFICRDTGSTIVCE